MLELIRKINSQKISKNEIENIVERFKSTKINIFDNHFSTSKPTNLILVKEAGRRRRYSVVAPDANGNIYKVGIWGGQPALNNAIGFGTLIGDKVEGWCFDREGTVAYGYESTCRYAEKAS